HWFLEQSLTAPHHYNQSRRLRLRQSAPRSMWERAIGSLLEHHDGLRLRLNGREVHQDPPTTSVPLLHIDLTELPADLLESALQDACNQLQRSLAPSRGRLFQAALCGDNLCLVIHHLAVDTVSWQILLDDLELAMESLQAGRPLRLPAPTTAFQEWGRRLT